MCNLIKALKETTLGDVLQPLKNMSLLDFTLSLTGACSILQLSTALCAKILGDDDTADWNMAGAFVSLLANTLLTMYAAEPDDSGADNTQEIQEAE